MILVKSFDYEFFPGMSGDMLNFSKELTYVYALFIISNLSGSLNSLMN